MNQASLEKDIFDIVLKNYDDKFLLCKSLCDYINVNTTSNTNTDKVAYWEFWRGWGGNCDKRIEDAKCSNCGYEHHTVYKTIDNLSKICPQCSSKMLIK